MNITKSILITSFILLIGTFGLMGQVTEFDRITKAIKLADTKTIFSLCDNSINLSTPDTYGKFSKTQTRKILDQFFKKQTPTIIKVIKTQTEKHQDYYTILDFKSINQTYTILIQLKEVESKFLIQKIQIQETKK